jgi:hypothetical protein
MRSTAGRAALEKVLEAGEESLPSLTRIVCVLLAVQSLVPLNPSDPAVAGHDPPQKTIIHVLLALSASTYFDRIFYTLLSCRHFCTTRPTPAP